MAITVLFITTGLGPGGAEIMLSQLLRNIDRARFAPAVISITEKDRYISPQIESLGIPVDSLSLPRGRISVSALGRLIQLTNRARPDVIQGWMYHGNFAASIASYFGKRRVPVMWSIHHCIYSLAQENALTRLIIRLGRHMARTTSGIAYVSAVSARQHEALGFPAKRTRLTPNGFDTTRFSPDLDRRAAFRAELGLGSDEIAIGLLSRYVPLKDHKTFLTAAAMVAERFPNTRFILSGHDVTWDNRQLRQQIEERALAARVNLLGYRSDIRRLLSGLDILTNTSYTEAFPLIVGEAMASEVPCIATDVGDTAWLLGDAGTLVPPRSPEALSTAMVRLVEATSEQRAQLGRRARARIVQEFSLSDSVRNYERLYQAAIGRH